MIDWTLTPYSSNSYNVFIASSNGYVYNDNNANYCYVGTPVLYLEAGVYEVDGNGSVSDPYILAI